MATLAAVMTGQTSSAIATIQVVGPEATTIVERLFQPRHSKPQPLEPGKVLIGTLKDREKSIDQIVLGCEAQDVLSLHCHGNPLMTETIMALLQKHGATLVRPQHVHAALLNQHPSLSTLTMEAHLALQKVKTLLGARLLSRQLTHGLTQWVQRWLTTDELPMSRFVRECRQILEHSGPVQYSLYGCTLVLIGPPNVGKSTLLNSLTGQDKAIVTDIKGTTRDWVTAALCTDRLYMNLIDTAGLDTAIRQHSTSDLEDASQKKTLQVLHSADLILLVLDQSQSAAQIDSEWCPLLDNKRVLIVQNKADLPCRLRTTELPCSAEGVVSVSAKKETGLAALVANIETILGIPQIDPGQPMCYTERQTRLIQALADSADHRSVKGLLNDLLHGTLN